MSSDAPHDAGLSELAGDAGIAVQWRDARGRSQQVAPDVLRTLLAALGFGADNPAMIEESSATLKRLRDEEVPGLVIVEVNQPIDLHGVAPASYQLTSEDGAASDGHASMGAAGAARLAPIAEPGYYTVFIAERAVALAVAPVRSPSVADLFGAGGARLWGVAAQVYSLRRTHGGDAAHVSGFGDFSALAELARAAGRQQAHAVAISPVHAMFSADPSRYSPYGPSSRLFLNALFADPAALLGDAAVADAIGSLGLSDELLRLDAASVIDWPIAGKARIGLMRSMYDHFRLHAHTPLHTAFGEFRKKGGEALESHARFEAMHARHLPPLGTCTDWRQWPAELRDPSSADVLHFAQAHEKDVGFHVFLQWLAADGLARAQVAAKDAGMCIGLIADLAVGTDPGGSHAWSRQQDILPGLSPGAPPDLYNPLGQSWGITAFSPTALRAHGYSAFIEMLRAVLAQAGGIRIDHVLGLARTWLVPDGAGAKDGAFLHYPLTDMLRLIALEAWRHRAIVIGENLGTVPAGFNDRIAHTGMMGMNVLWFERGHAHSGRAAPFIAPHAWPPHSIATTTTHDLPTVTGWWRERDIDWRVKLALLGEDDTEASLRADRGRDREALWDALRASGSTSVGENPDAATPPAEVPLDAVLAHVATSRSPLLIVPIEDLVGAAEQPNIPSTVYVHPNWTRRLEAGADEIFTSDTVRRRSAIISQARSTP
jgi:4-alpha-glucanotransferase